MMAENNNVNKSAYAKYEKACALTREFMTDKFSKAKVTKISDPLNWHTIEITIDAGTDFDGTEVEKLSELLSCFDYVVFEDTRQGKVKLSCSVDNIYGDEGKPD